MADIDMQAEVMKQRAEDAEESLANLKSKEVQDMVALKERK